VPFLCRFGSAGNDHFETFGREALAQLGAKPPVRPHSDHDRGFHGFASHAPKIAFSRHLAIDGIEHAIGDFA
jgi:hypothetical protein